MADDEEASEPAAPNSANANPRQLARNFFASYLGVAASLLLSLVLTPIVLRFLGPTDYGLWILIATIGSYVGLLGAGVGTAATQSVASEMAVGNHRAVGEILATARVSLLGSAVLGMAAAGAFFPFVGNIFDLHGASLREMRWGLVLMAVSSGVNLVSAVPSAALTGAGFADVTSIVALVLGVMTMGLQIAAVAVGGGVLVLVAITAGSGLASFLTLDLVARRRRLGALRGYRPSRESFSKLLRSGGRNVTVSLAGTITYGLDAFVVGALLSVEKVAAYDIGLSVANALQSVSTTATNGLLPTYAHSSAIDDRDRQFRMFTRAVVFSMAVVSPMVVAVVAFGRPLLGLWLGRVPEQTYEVTVAANVLFALQIPGHQAFIFLTAVGRNATLARIALPLAVLNVAFSIFATLWLGAVGPVVGDLPQMLVVEFAILPLLCVRLVGRSYRDYAKAVFLPIAIPLASSILAAGILILFVGRTSQLSAPFEAVAVVLVGLAVFVPVQMRLDPSARIILRHAMAVLGLTRHR